jgi:hypothetical protein
MGSMPSLKFIFVNVQSLSGPLPELHKARTLERCDFTNADYCRGWDAPPATASCDMKIVPICNTDCLILYEWIKTSPGRCCSFSGISCDKEGRIDSM